MSDPRTRVRPLHYVEYGAIRCVIGTLGLVPDALAYRIARWLGGVFLRFAPRRRAYALRQLRNAFPDLDDSQRLRLAARGVGNLLQVTLDMARIGRLVERGALERYVDLREFDALGIEPPYIGVTPHLGSWETAAVSCAARTDTGLHVTARLMKNPLAQRWLARSRARAGVIVHDRRGGFRGIANALREGRVVMQVVDQHQRLRGVVAHWFGELASCERAAATLAIRQQVRLGVGTCIRLGDAFRFRMVVQEILDPEPTGGDREAAVVRMVERMNRAQEDLIRRFPEQYLWIHNRYRGTPDVEAARRDDRAAGAEVEVG